MSGDIPNRGPKLYAVTISCFLLAFIGVALRTYVRARIVKSVGWDDYLLIFSVLLYSVYISFVFMGLRYGTGRHHVDLKPEDISKAVRFWYFCEWQYVLTTTVIKIAVGIFYLRIMVTRWQRLVVKAVMLICIIFGGVYFVAVVLQCVPVSYIWSRYSDPTAKGKCLPNVVVVGGTYLHSIISASSDWTLGLLPITLLWNSLIAWRVKALLIFVLGLGALASTSTLIRLSVIHHIDELDDFLWITFPIAIWSTVEPGVALFAAGLASLRPLLRAIFHLHFQSEPLRVAPRFFSSSSFGNENSFASSSAAVKLGPMVQTGPMQQTQNVVIGPELAEVAGTQSQIQIQTSGGSGCIEVKKTKEINYFARRAETTKGLFIKLHADEWPGAGSPSHGYSHSRSLSRSPPHPDTYLLSQSSNPSQPHLHSQLQSQISSPSRPTSPPRSTASRSSFYARPSLEAARNYTIRIYAPPPSLRISDSQINITELGNEYDSQSQEELQTNTSESEVATTNSFSPLPATTYVPRPSPR